MAASKWLSRGRELRSLFASPRLEHENRPQGRRRVAPAAEVLLPPRPDETWVEPARRLHRRGLKQLLRPIAKRALDPFTNGYSKAGLGPFEHLARSFPVKQIT